MADRGTLGFVWNYRVLPHVHCYVNIAARPQA